MFSSPLCWAWLELEMDYVLLLKWSGDTDKNTTGRITEIEGGGSQEIGRQRNKGFVKLPHQSEETEHKLFT